MMAYVLENNSTVINMMQLNSEKSFDPINVDSQYNITDIDANERYIFVTVKGAKEVHVYKNDLSKFAIDHIIDEKIMPTDHQGFYPQETALSPTDINTLVIRNYNSIILMRVTAFISEYITQIFVH